MAGWLAGLNPSSSAKASQVTTVAFAELPGSVQALHGEVAPAAGAGGIPMTSTSLSRLSDHSADR